VRRRLQEGRQPFPDAAEFHITSDDLCIPKPLQTVRDLQIKFLVGTGIVICQKPALEELTCQRVFDIPASSADSIIHGRIGEL
jgi:hypothetical protein